MIIAELRGRHRQSAIVLGGEGQSLGTMDTFSIRTCRHSLKPCLHKFSQMYTDTNLAVNHFSLTAKFLSVFIKEHKSRT